MGYAVTWKILEEIVIELRKKGIAFPEKVMADLRSANTLSNSLTLLMKTKVKWQPSLNSASQTWRYISSRKLRRASLKIVLMNGFNA